MEFLAWLGFGLAVATILVISRWHLGLSLLAAALVLAVFTMGPGEFGSVGLDTFTAPKVLLLALAVATIPMIGGYMERSGLMDSLVRNMRVSRKVFLAGMPAMLGMLPMPGGALLSAPIVKGGGEGVSAEAKVCLNVWFRHVIYLAYPMSTSLIVSSYIAGLSIYAVLPYLLPFLALALVLGAYFFLGEAKGKVSGEGEFSWKGLLVPLGILLAAPVADFTILTGLEPEIREASLVAAVLLAFALAAIAARADMRSFPKVARRMKPWNYGSIILGLFLFLGVFMASGVPGLIGGLDMPPLLLCAGVGFALGMVTGRMEVPASIVIPIYLGTTGLAAMAPWVFAVTYSAIFVGYLLTPVHPCTSISLEYFGVSLGRFMRRMAAPALIMLAVTVAVGIFVF